ncbi:MAG: HK97 family phage prohead protease [Minisyncoccia bacterium]
MAKTLLKSENRIRNISFKVKSVDKVNFTVEGVFSAEVEDRQGEIVVQSGWLLDNYLKNPVVLWAHRSDQPPIAKMLQIGVNAATNQLEGKMQFAVNEYDFAGTIFKLIDGGYQSAFSAGFINNKYEIDQQNDKVYLVENELLEMSVVPVPANQLALAKSKGIDITEYKEKIAIIEDEEESPSADADEEEDEDEELAESGTLVTEEKAVEIISKSNMETIRRAIGTLTEVLKAHTPIKTQVKVGNSGDKKIPVRLLNRAVKELLGVKKSIR